MASTFDDTVLDFDLNFLQQPASTVTDCKFDKQRKAVLIAKKKTVATDSLIKKYYAKNEKLEQTEVLLLAAKEECKKVCLDYKESLERCSQLEKDIQLLKTQNKEFEDSSIVSKTQYEAIKSHAHQLQVLVKEHETIIEGLKIENHLNKNNGKDYEKKFSDLEKENKTILKHLFLVKDIVFGKKKLKCKHKLMLENYDKLKSKVDVEDSSDESGEENDFLDSLPPSPMSVQDVAEHKKGIALNLNGKVNFGKKGIENDEFDYSNEVVSEDTGRGSSLALSDGEKCYNSPDYCHADTLFNTDTSKIKERKIYIDIGTSPLHRELVDIATSPVMFDDEVCINNDINKEFINESSNIEYVINEIPFSSDIVSIKEKKKMVDSSTSPMQVDKVHVSTSPVMFNEVNIAISKHLENNATIDKVLEKVHASTSPLLFEGIVSRINSEVNEDISMQNIDNVSNKSTIDIGKTNETSHEVSENPINNVEPTQIHIQDLTSHCEIEISGKSSSAKEKNCLERNNSNNICNETGNDLEIEMILSSMRLTERLITPIPKTPVKSIKKKGRPNKIISPTLERNAPSMENNSVHNDVLNLKEENRALKSSVSTLSKEIMNIKQILKKQRLMPESPKRQANEKAKVSMADLFGDSSQDIITLIVDSETNNDKDTLCEKVTSIVNVSSSENVSKNTTRSSVCEEGYIVQNVEILNEEDVQIAHKESLDSMPENNISNDIRLSKDGPDIVSDAQKERYNGKEDHLTEYKTREEDINYVNKDKCAREHDNNDFIEVVDDGKRKRKAHSHKLSRLEKFRKQLLPKSKIASFTAPPIKKSHANSKLPVLTTNQHQQNTNRLSNSKTSLDNQIAYEKAVKVMKELKLKENNKEQELKKRSPKAQDRKKSETESNEAENSEITDIFKNAIIKQPVVCLSPLNLDGILNKSGSDNDLSDSDGIHYVVEIVDTPTKKYMTRSQSNMSNRYSISSRKSSTESISNASDETYKECDGTPPRKRLKLMSSDGTPEETCKRVLRSTSIREKLNIHVSEEQNPDITDNDSPTYKRKLPKRNSVDSKQKNSARKDLSELFDKSNEPFSQYDFNEELEDSYVDEGVVPNNHPKNSILCKILNKYGKARVKYNPKKIPDNITNSICKKLEDSIAQIIVLPDEKTKAAMSKLVQEIQQTWHLEHFLSGFLKYLKDPARKMELFSKSSAPPAPTMTKSEQVVLFIVLHLSRSVPNFVHILLSRLDFVIFQLNKSPEFDVIESLSHVYALICRYFGLLPRVRLFLLDAMYSLSFKAVPLIKQCLDVWMHILPLAHMGVAKNPLVTCIVYLLHFYKCEDRYKRVQDIRYILNRKYFYKITDWNEPKILEMFMASIKDVTEIQDENKLLRMALVILAKRQGATWCQNNIIKKMLMPLIEQEDLPLRVRKFCVEMLGPLLKPFPPQMKVHCEIAVNNLLDMMEDNPPDSLMESIFTSLIFMSKHNQDRVIQALLWWSPKHITPEFEKVLIDFVQEKPSKAWAGIISRITF